MVKTFSYSVYARYVVYNIYNIWSRARRVPKTTTITSKKTTPTRWFVKLSLATMCAYVFYCPQPHKRLPRVIETHTWTTTKAAEARKIQKKKKNIGNALRVRSISNCIGAQSHIVYDIGIIKNECVSGIYMQCVNNNNNFRTVITYVYINNICIEILTFLCITEVIISSRGGVRRHRAPVIHIIRRYQNAFVTVNLTFFFFFF